MVSLVMDVMKLFSVFTDGNLTNSKQLCTDILDVVVVVETSFKKLHICALAKQYVE